VGAQGVPCGVIGEGEVIADRRPAPLPQVVALGDDGQVVLHAHLVRRVRQDELHIPAAGMALGDELLNPLALVVHDGLEDDLVAPEYPHQQRSPVRTTPLTSQSMCVRV